MVEVVLGESNDIVAHGHGVLITEHRSDTSWQTPVSIVRTSVIRATTRR